MPRRNSRRRYRHEGELGFNPYKYIGSKEYLSPQKQIVCVEREDSPADSRYKTRQKTAKNRRAWTEMYQMQQTTEKVRMPESLPLKLRTPVKPAREPQTQSVIAVQKPTQSAPTPHSMGTPVITIIGGIKNWIRTILHA